MTAADLVHDLQVRGVKLIADGGTLRCRPKSALSDSDLAALRALKPQILATLQHPTPPRPAARITCYICRGRRFWVSIHAVTICAVCHPPPDPRLIGDWITTDGGAGA